MGGYLSKKSENTLIKQNPTEDRFSVRSHGKMDSDNKELNCKSN